MTREAGTAVIENFRDKLKTYSEVAQSLDGHGKKTKRGGSGSRKRMEFSGFAHYFDANIESWRRKYGDAIVGEAIEDISDSFDLSNPHLFYWTTNEDVQEDIEDTFGNFKDQFEDAAEEIQRILEEEGARQRAREQAEQARETEEKYKQMEEEAAKASNRGIGQTAKAIANAFVKGISGKASSIGSAIKGVFSRFGRKK